MILGFLLGGVCRTLIFRLVEADDGVDLDGETGRTLSGT
jgi:hypothetical protein